MTTPPGLPAMPKALGRYEIQSEIGRGSMGVVYKAEDPVLGRSVALKVIHVAFPVGEEEERSLEQRFLLEASLAASLSHPNIVVVHDVGRDPRSGTPFIALEYLEGWTLADVMATGKSMDWRVAARMVACSSDYFYGFQTVVYDLVHFIYQFFSGHFRVIKGQFGFAFNIFVIASFGITITHAIFKQTRTACEYQRFYFFRMFKNMNQSYMSSQRISQKMDIFVLPCFYKPVNKFSKPAYTCMKDIHLQ
jgi:hypothetical protein